jgi:hypothetical protein
MIENMPMKMTPEMPASPEEEKVFEEALNKEVEAFKDLKSEAGQLVGDATLRLTKASIENPDTKAE